MTHMMAAREDSAAPPALMLLTGDELLLVDRAIWRVTAAARRQEPGIERRDATAAGLSAGEFWDLVAPSLFAEPRVVVVRSVQEAVKELATALTSYLADPVEGVTLVLHHGGGARNKAVADAMTKAGATIVVCNKITKPAERIDFVRAEIRRAGGTTTPDAVAALVDAVGTDLRELASTASQLVADTGGMVDEKAVRRYHRGKAEVSGFAVADSVMAGDLPAALESLRWAEGIGLAPVLIADALADGVRTIAKVHGARGSNSYALASQLGMPPWKIDRAKVAGRGWSTDGLVAGMAVVAELNASVKGAAVDNAYALEKAVIDLVAARGRR
jgi:DNA polymerase-3 subunit delta